MYSTSYYMNISNNYNWGLYEGQSGLGDVLEVVAQLLQLRLLEVGLGGLLRQHVQQDVNLVMEINYFDKPLYSQFITLSSTIFTYI